MNKAKIVSEEDRGTTYIQEFPLYILTKRMFFIENVPANVVRGKHANKNTNQLLICIAGTIRVKYNDGKNKAGEVFLEKGNSFYLKARTYVEMDFSGPEAILMVLADHKYDKNEYINGWDNFLKEVK